MTTWSQVSSYVPSGGPIAAAAAPGAISAASGWQDLSGNTWSVSSANQLTSAYSGTPWNTAALCRPSSEAQIDGRIRIGFVANATSGASIFGLLRHSGVGSTTNAFYAGFNGLTSPSFGLVVNGSQSTIGAGTLVSGAVNMTAGTTYVMQADIVQTNATTSTMTLTLFAADGVTQLAQLTQTSSQSGLQNVTGTVGVFVYLTSYVVTSLASYTDVAAATAYTLAGPSSGTVGTASTSFTAAANGTLSSNVVITPSDGGAGGTFTPSTVTLTSAATTGTFTYTASSTGTKTIGATNNGGLTNPSSVSYAAASASPPITIPVNSPAFRFSPGNWKGDTGRGGAVYRQAWNNGAYVDVAWTASASPTATLLLPTSSTGCMVSYILNGVLTDGVAATGNITLSGLVPSAINTLRVILKNSPQSSRWNNGTNVVQVQGLQVDSGSAAAAAATVTGWDLIVGDSLSEGIAAADGSDSFLKCYSYLLGQWINDQGRDFCLSACGYSGWVRSGDSTGDVPPYYYTPGGTYNDALSRWNKIDQGVPLLDIAGQISAYGATGTPPTNIYIDYGTNESLNSTTITDMQAAIQQGLVALRAAAPAARIVLLIPFTLYATAVFSSGPTYVAAIKAAVAAYQSAHPGDTNVVILDFGAALSATLTSTLYGGAVVHPLSGAHAIEGAKLIGRLASLAVKAVFRRGFHS